METDDKIIQISVDTFEQHISTGLKNIFITGSRAFGESTELGSYERMNDKVIVSDIDAFVEVGFLTFFKTFLNNSISRMSKDINKKFSKLGCKTHVSISIYNKILANYFGISRPNSVFMYEFTRVCHINDRYVMFDSERSTFPDGRDILNLVISAIADYLFIAHASELGDEMEIEEKIYVLSKRCLSLLYSLLLINNIHSSSYKERIERAIKYFDDLSEVITPNDLDILQTLTNYKISGDHNLLVTFNDEITSLKDYTIFISDYFEDLTRRILYYMLNTLYIDNGLFSDNKHKDILELFEVLKTSREVSLFNSLLKSTLSVISFFRHRNSTRMRFEIWSLMSEGIKGSDLLRYWILVYFIKRDSHISRLNISSIKGYWDIIMM